MNGTPFCYTEIKMSSNTLRSSSMTFSGEASHNYVMAKLFFSVYINACVSDGDVYPGIDRVSWHHHLIMSGKLW